MQDALFHPLDAGGQVEDFLDDDTANVDFLMAKEMASLSTRDRERIYHDIHGISDEIAETKDFIRQSLQLMDEELLSCSLEKRAYKLALKQNPVYVQNSQLRLRFLRADCFDPKAAAQRFILHFNLKQEFFGEKLLTKDITQDDLEHEDLDMLYNCVAYCMPTKDPAGRLVIFYKAQPTNVSVRSFVRRLFYATMTCTEDEATQRRGCVIVSYLIGQMFSFQEISKRRELNRWNATVFCAVPLRVEALHLCIDSFYWRPFLAIFKLTVSMFTRLRCREHYGNHQSVLFSLQTHGITMDFVQAAVVSNESNTKFWLKRRELEHQFSHNDQIVESIVSIPSKSDVLLGRGKSSYNHVGNIRLRNLVEHHAEGYEDSSFAEKTVLADVIVLQIKKESGRFLRDDGYGWMEVDDETARNKVAHAFRTLRGQKVSTGTKADKKRGRGS